MLHLRAAHLERMLRCACVCAACMQCRRTMCMHVHAYLMCASCSQCSNSRTGVRCTLVFVVLGQVSAFAIRWRAQSKISCCVQCKRIYVATSMAASMSQRPHAAMELAACMRSSACLSPWVAICSVRRSGLLSWQGFLNISKMHAKHMTGQCGSCAWMC